MIDLKTTSPLLLLAAIAVLMVIWFWHRHRKHKRRAARPSQEVLEKEMLE